MKILNVTQVQQADAHTIQNEPVKSIDLMERASTKFVEAFKELFQQPCKIAVVCGPGNNGGDGLAVSRILLNQGYQVQPVIVQAKPGGSPDFLTNLERLRGQAGQKYSLLLKLPTSLLMILSLTPFLAPD
jgi:NAD(P)H-hydrate epimerase